MVFATITLDIIIVVVDDAIKRHYMGITASENFSSKSVNFAVSKSVRSDNVDWFISPHCDKLEFEESDQLIHIKYLKKKTNFFYSYSKM